MLSDTPGILAEPAYKLQDTMMTAAKAATRDAECLLFVTDIFEDEALLAAAEWTRALLPQEDAPPVLGRAVFHRKDFPQCRSAAAATTWIFRGKARRRRGYDADIPRKAVPRLRRGYSEEKRGAAAATTWTFRGRVAAPPRLRR